jgi:hypothetical protein
MGSGPVRRVVVFLSAQLANECRLQGDDRAGDEFETQGLVLAEMLAEDGDEQMATMVAASGCAISVGVHRLAARLKALERA